MPKYINADEAIEIARERHMDDGLYDLDEYCLILDFLDTMPAADVVDVVRCKDCKYFEPVSEYSGNCYRNEINNIFDGYCNKAERRESEC